MGQMTTKTPENTTEWTEITLLRPLTGERLFRYSADRRATGRPVRVEVKRGETWRACPNVDVSDAIMMVLAGAAQ